MNFVFNKDKIQLNFLDFSIQDEIVYMPMTAQYSKYLDELLF